MASFDEKVSVCLENIVEFADIINKIDNSNSKCYLECFLMNCIATFIGKDEALPCEKLFSRFV